MTERIEVAEYADLASRTELSQREIDNCLAELNETDAPILVVKEWLVDKKSIEPMDGWVRLFRVDALLATSDDAWRVRISDEKEWIPKSQSILIERADGVDEISSPSATLMDFGGGQA